MSGETTEMPLSLSLGANSFRFRSLSRGFALISIALEFIKMFFQAQISKEEQPVTDLPSSNNSDDLDGGGVRVSCFSEAINDVPVHFQIICLSKQIYVWIGCNSAKFGNLYAAAPTRPNNTVSVTSILGGSSDNTGSSMARRLVLKTGLNIILASNIPKNSPMLEVAAEKMLVQKLVSLGYIRPKSEGKGHL